MIKNRTVTFLCLVLACIFSTSVLSANNQAAIATAHPVATKAGLDILKQGGNAFDAAVAISATLAVVEPYSSGLGGGGFWLLQDARTKKNIIIDGREVAPLSATETLYQDKKGNVVKNLSINGALAAGIPGQVAALVHIAEQYGSLPLTTLLAPAIKAARRGFKVSRIYHRMAGFRLKALQQSPDAAKIFLLRNRVPHIGYLVKQPDLANTLEVIAKQGKAGFYAGSIAEALVNGTKQAGGIWSLKDLSEYKIKQRAAITGYYKNFKIISASPPSSGGIALVTMLNILEQHDLTNMKQAQRMHIIVEAMRRAYRDRAEFLGDPDFVSIPAEKLISKTYAKKLNQSIVLNKATPSASLKPANPVIQGQHTTHFSVVDSQGNKVSATLSINFPFGSCFVPPGTGVLLNDEMDDFSAKPGEPNVYGLVGNRKNAIEGGKRMLSSMSPSIVEDATNGDYAIIGTPGGSRIITMVLHGILAFTEGKSAGQIVAQPRYHHQYLPDTIFVEDNVMTDASRADMLLKKHQIKRSNRYGNMQIIVKRANKLTAASDPRGEGLAVVSK